MQQISLQSFPGIIIVVVVSKLSDIHSPSKRRRSNKRPHRAQETSLRFEKCILDVVVDVHAVVVAVVQTTTSNEITTSFLKAEQFVYCLFLPFYLSKK